MAQTTFDNTRAALAEYDRTQAERDAAWDAAQTDEHVTHATQSDSDALNMIRRAYNRDTHLFNSIQHCMLVDLEFMRLMASKD